MKLSTKIRGARLITNGNLSSHGSEIDLNAPIGDSKLVGTLGIIEKASESLCNENQLHVPGPIVPEEQTRPPTTDEQKSEDVASIGDEKPLEEKGVTNSFLGAHPLLAEISPFQTGVVIVNVSDAALLPSVRTVLGALALDKSSVLGIPMPQAAKAVHSLISGSSRHIEQYKVFAKANAGGVGEAINLKLCNAQGRLDWLSNEGLHVLSPFVEEAKDGWLIIEHVMAGPITPDMTQVLIRIGSLAKKFDTRVMLLIVCPLGQNKSLISGVCEDYLEVDFCDPEVGAVLAFSVDCIGIRDLNSLGVGKTMCSVTFSDGLFRHRFDPFISSSLETRVMGVMRSQGKSLDEIGVFFKKNKSSVLRRLQGLPKFRQFDLPKNWLSNNLEALVDSSGD